MSSKIPTIGKIWIIAMIIIQGISAVANIIAGFSNLPVLAAGLFGVVAVASAVMLLLGKGKLYFIAYCVGYGVSGLIVQTVGGNMTAAFAVGFVIGLGINFGLTYLASKATFEEEK